MNIQKFIESLGPADMDNVYELRPDKEGVWWLEHKQVGSEKPLEQALNNCKHKCDWVIVVARIITFPLFIVIALYGASVLFVKYIYNYIRYGGETIAYTHKNQRKMIHDLYFILKKIHKVNEEPMDISSLRRKLY